MGYVLTTEAMRVVTKNDRGVVNYRKRYRKGDVVDTSKMDEDRVASLVASGALVDENDTEAQEDQEPTGDPVHQPATPTPTEGSVGSDGTDGDVGEPIPDLDNMSYQDLKALAAEKDLDTSGNTEALHSRLTDYYTS